MLGDALHKKSRSDETNSACSAGWKSVPILENLLAASISTFMQSRWAM